MKKQGVLLVNLGTPDSPRVEDVRRYLSEFLMDERVMGMPLFLRLLLVRGLIVPFRSSHSARAYQKIWEPDGSPLLIHSEQLKRKLAELLSVPVALGMRYGNPSMKHGIEELYKQGVTEIILVPLYPHYTQSTYESVEICFRSLLLDYSGVSCRIVSPFYNRPEYIEALCRSISERDTFAKSDHLLFSFHGIPVSHDGGSGIYEQQCRATASLVAERMNLSDDFWSVSFQSRLGKGEWLQPYTFNRLAELPSHGVNRLAVIAPAFTADCLETLEELAMDGKELFLNRGGETFDLIPCLNSAPYWVETLKTWLEEEYL